MDINELLKEAVTLGASDLHITVGAPPIVRLHGDLRPLNYAPLEPSDTEYMASQILNEEKKAYFESKGEVDLSYNCAESSCFRVNIFRQRDVISIACRVINTVIPTIESLGLPPSVSLLARRSKGLILVTGPTGAGKSTTIASLINLINTEKSCHILTLEDPIEYLHRHQKSIITQREIGRDSMTFPDALRAALRQDPDVILVGEMRDLETISIAITAAETGHLVLATLHTMDAPQTVERIIDVFPPGQQQQIRVQLANTLAGVLSQRLLRRVDGKGRVAVMESLICTPAVRNMIRDNKIHQIYSVMQTSAKAGMQTIDNHLFSLYERGLISSSDVHEHAVDKEAAERFIEFPFNEPQGKGNFGHRRSS
ncbi:type IV pilus twitching motility protein PilT [Heliorestis acidaminivorans]|uniref:Type IV pilus twitching motility protein PilT n=1 Tax=Heliorestis acidaminivorans TaxID=553427 RepID=A0A6I0EV00_9FIRM|nr:type IV pilus twitching motility protein PilT [Heliorestis acidaminivorans]KAB2951658.1 type IV pilus twitching motility protein PilT [Heliorestis acidaminivorans]